MKYFLVEYVCDWADEFDLFETTIFTEEGFEEFKNNLPKTITVSGYLGNIDAENEHSKKEYLNSLEITEITEQEYNVLNRYYYRIFKGNCSAFDFN